ncbi:MAG TPA: hypothetical protein VIX42_00230 [Edaphobacter sp.]
MNETNIETKKRYQCRHIFTDGRRCGSACLRYEEFCYYHHTTRRPAENPRQRRNRRSTFDLPLPEDRSAIQHSIGEVLRRIASNDIDPRRAGLLLYGLQIASLNLPKPQPGRRSTPEIETVEEITLDPTHGPLAPKIEVEKARRSVIRALLDATKDLPPAEPAAQSETLTPVHLAETGILPNLQATSAPLTNPLSPTKKRHLLLPFSLVPSCKRHPGAFLVCHPRRRSVSAFVSLQPFPKTSNPSHRSVLLS